MNFAVITDSNIAALYNIRGLIVPAGEQSKSLQMVEYLASQLSGRDTTIIAIGGGMIMDLAGFLAATYCRGVKLVLVPTSLLAMVDASIGGKTAVNLAAGKNLLGTTTFPDKVIIHLPFLSTLPDTEWENGIVEILKAGLIADPFLFFHYAHLSQEEVIDRAIEVKRRLVAQDPYDSGSRSLLNLGHTIGHALETYSNYQLAHGKAVAQGIILESRISHALGILSPEDLEIIEAHFPSAKIPYDTDAIFALLAKDKKTRDGKAHFVLLKKIGEPYIHEGRYCHPVPENIIREILYENSLCSC